MRDWPVTTRAAWLSVLAAVTVVGLLPAVSHAGTVRGKVVRVVDGDSVKVKVGKRTRTYHLKGVDAPELRGTEAEKCYGRTAKRRLGRLLKRRARVKVRTRGRSRQAEVFRGRRNVNRSMVRGGHARAKARGGSLGRRLRRDEAVAKRRNRGLWKACAQAPGGGAPGAGVGAPGGAQPGDITGQAAIDQLTAELRDAAFRTFNNDNGISSEFQLHLCGDGRFRFSQNTTVTSPVSRVSIIEKFGNPWTVFEALVRPDGSYRGARGRGTFTQQRNRGSDGESTQRINEPVEARIENLNGQWYLDGKAAQHFAGQASCDPAP